MKLFYKIGGIIAAVLTAIVLTTAPAAAQSSTSVGVNNQLAAGAAANLNQKSNSVGLAGLPGGICSEGFTLGAQGAGIGFSFLKNPCLVIQTVPGLVRVGVLTNAEGAALVKSAYSRLGFTLSQKTPTAAPAKSPKPVARPAMTDYQAEKWSELTHYQQHAVRARKATWNGRMVAIK